MGDAWTTLERLSQLDCFRADLNFSSKVCERVVEEFDLCRTSLVSSPTRPSSSSSSLTSSPNGFGSLQVCKAALCAATLSAFPCSALQSEEGVEASSSSSVGRPNASSNAGGAVRSEALKAANLDRRQAKDLLLALCGWLQEKSLSDG